MSAVNLRIPDWAIALVLSIVAALLFWPGSVGWDYNQTIYEATTWKFSGHQPPSAAVATSILSLGTGNPYILTVSKFLVYFLAIGIVLKSHQMSRLLRILLLVVLFSPTLVYYLPLLRSNAFEVVFLALAFSAGLAAPTRRNMCIAAVSLVGAILFSAGINPGHLCLIVLYLLWHFPRWGNRKLATLSVAVIALVLVPSLLVAVISRNTDRSSTLYMSSIVGIDGLVRLGVPSCLPHSIVRDAGHSPDEVLKSNTERARPWAVALAIGAKQSPFLTPGELTDDQKREVFRCWISMISDHPLLYLQERADWFARTVFSPILEEYFVYVSVDGSLQRVDQALTERFDLQDRAAIGAMESYGAVASSLRLDRFTPYATLFIILSVLAFLSMPERWKFLTFSVLAVLGFLVPHALFGQAPQFRYFLVPSFVAAFLSVAIIDLLSNSRLGRWIARLRDMVVHVFARIWSSISKFADGARRGKIEDERQKH